MLIALIPAYNEASQVGLVVAGVAALVDRVIVVDDASTDDTAACAAAAGALVLRHVVNRGAGGATATGLRAARRLGADFAVTLDADGQHLAGDLPALLKPLQDDSADLVIGSRLLAPQGMPWLRRGANQAANLVTRVLHGAHVSDSQSGYKAFNRKALQAIHPTARGFEFCTELLGQATRARLRVVEVPITVVYTDYSRSKGQGLGAGLQTLGRLLLRKLT